MPSEISSKTKWMGSVRWTTFFGWTGSIEMDRSFDHSDAVSTLGPRCSVSSVYIMEENNYHYSFMDCKQLIGVTRAIHVQLRQVCSCFPSKMYVLVVGDGSKRRFISQENLECSFRV